MTVKIKLDNTNYQSSNSPLPARLYSLDLARGMAALVVVIWHWQHFFFLKTGLPASFVVSAQPFFSILKPFYLKGGEMAVPFFFALSGFIFFWLYEEKIRNRSCSLNQFVRARFARLYPLHLATLILVLILQCLFKKMYGYDFVYFFNDLYHFFLHLFFASYWGFERGWSFNAPVWSVSIEIALYATFFVLAYFKCLSFWRVVVIVGAIISLPSLGLSIGRWSHPLECFFVGGLTFYGLTQYLKWNCREAWMDLFIIVTSAVGWILFLGPLWVGEGNGDVPFQISFLFSLTIAGLVLAEMLWKPNLKNISWIGEITYSSYLLHFPLQIIFMMFALALTGDSSVFTHPATFISYFIVLIWISRVCHRTVEIPLQSWLLGRSPR